MTARPTQRCQRARRPLEPAWHCQRIDHENLGWVDARRLGARELGASEQDVRRERQGGEGR